MSETRETRDSLGRVLCCHGRPIYCNECGDDYVAELNAPPSRIKELEADNFELRAKAMRNLIQGTVKGYRAGERAALGPADAADAEPWAQLLNRLDHVDLTTAMMVRDLFIEWKRVSALHAGQWKRMARLEEQARDISVQLTDAGCSAMTIPEGVAWLIRTSKPASPGLPREPSLWEQFDELMGNIGLAPPESRWAEFFSLIHLARAEDASRLAAAEQERAKWKGRCEECIDARIAVERERDSARALVKEICDDWNEDCDSSCNSYAHTETCKSINIAQAKRALRERAEAAEQKVRALEGQQAHIKEVLRRAVKIVPRPWIDKAIGNGGTLTFDEWEAFMCEIDAVLAPPADPGTVTP